MLFWNSELDPVGVLVDAGVGLVAPRDHVRHRVGQPVFVELLVARPTQLERIATPTDKSRSESRSAQMRKYV